MSRLLSVVAGVVALVGFAGFMTRVAPVWLVFPPFMVAMLFLVFRRAMPEMLLGPADPALPPPAPALASGSAQGTVGTRPMALTVRVHADRIVVGQPLYGWRTIMADQLTGLGWEHDGSLRIDHVAGTLRAAPVRLSVPPGAPLRQAIEAFAVRRPVLAVPTPAPGWWTFMRVWAVAAGTVGVGVGVFEMTRGNPIGAQLAVAMVVAAVVVWFLASGWLPRR